jgi:tripartite-type tricarboxylate transporter receptor subunit TctC
MRGLPTRRNCLQMGAGALASATLQAVGQAFPERVIRIVVAYPPGGPLDFVARLLSPGVAKRLMQPVVVENRPGGNGLIAAQYVASAKPDGHTLHLCLTTPYSMLPAMHRRPLAFDPNARTDILLAAAVQSVLVVHPRTGMKSMKDYISRAAQNPGLLTYASPGTAQIFTLAKELLKVQLSLDVRQIPYQGVAPALQAVLAGTVDCALLDVGTTAPHVAAGRLVPLCVLGKQRPSAMPSVPTLEEVGLHAIDIPLIWIGVVAPPEVPPAIADRLNSEFNKELQEPAVQLALAQQSLDPLGGSSTQLKRSIDNDTRIWGTLIRKLDLRLEE